jgi:hypothetical protein
MDPKENSSNASLTFENIAAEIKENGYFTLPPNTNFDLMVQLPYSPKDPFGEQSLENLGTFSVDRGVPIGNFISITEREGSATLGRELTNPKIINAYKDLKTWFKRLEIPSEYFYKDPFAETGTSIDYEKFFKDHPELTEKKKLLRENISILQREIDEEFFKELGLEIPKDFRVLYLDITLAKGKSKYIF